MIKRSNKVNSMKYASYDVCSVEIKDYVYSETTMPRLPVFAMNSYALKSYLSTLIR